MPGGAPHLSRRRLDAALGLLVLVACAEPPPQTAAELELDGPAAVRVATLGPVHDEPRAVDGQGAVLDDVTVHVEPAGVARVDERGHVVAVGPGRATVTLERGDAEVSWELVVELETTLRLVDAPADAPIGKPIPLSLESWRDGAPVDTPHVKWSCAPETRCRVTPDGVMHGTAEGLVWVTARTTGASATAEIELVSP
jgi:hypothetical protein